MVLNMISFPYKKASIDTMLAFLYGTPSVGVIFRVNVPNGG